MAQRDHKRTLAQRNQLAYDQGYRGKGGGVEGAYRAKRNARANDAPLPTDTNARPDRKQITKLGTGKRRLVKPLKAGSDPVVMAQLRNANGQVRIQVTTADGVVHNILSKGGWNVGAVLGRIESDGSLDAFIADQLASAYGDDKGESGTVVDFAVDLM